MKIIGLTGGIGSGKSTVARFLKELGAEVVDLDKVGHDVLIKGSSAYARVVREFGHGILKFDGEIDRTWLGKIVFNSHEALNQLNQIVHPEIDKIVAQKVTENRRKGVKVMVLEAAAMLEAERTWQVDEIWVTTASEETVLERLKARLNYSETEIKNRIKSQMIDEERVKQATVVINNDCTLDELKERVKAEWVRLLGRVIDS
jgi:dephospho-CoA kinase